MKKEKVTAHTRSALKVVLMVEIVPRFFATLTGIWELSLVHSRASVSLLKSVRLL